MLRTSHSNLIRILRTSRSFHHLGAPLANPFSPCSFLGDEIYRSPAPPVDQPNAIGGAVANPPISVFEVDGKKAKVRREVEMET